MIIITATFVLANPESRPEAVAKAIPLQQATRDGEPGCEAYVFSPDPAEENKERYMSFGRIEIAFMLILTTKITSIWAQCLERLV